MVGNTDNRDTTGRETFRFIPIAQVFSRVVILPRLGGVATGGTAACR